MNTNRSASDNMNIPEAAAAKATLRNQVSDRLNPHGYFTITCYDEEGVEKWSEDIPNTVVNEGKEYILGAALSGATQVTTHYLGLIQGSSPTIAAIDTLAFNECTEDTCYDEASRQTWSEGGASGQSITNSGSAASFTMNASVTIGGAFLTSDNTKGGTTGTLIAAGTFSTARSVASGDTINVTYTINA